jgi:hypothetical protein
MITALTFSRFACTRSILYRLGCLDDAAFVSACSFALCMLSPLLPDVSVYIIHPEGKGGNRKAEGGGRQFGIAKF